MRPPDPHLTLWIGQLSERVTKLERRVTRLAKSINDLWTWGKRCALIAAIWISAVWTNAAPEDKAAMISALISSLGGGR